MMRQLGMTMLVVAGVSMFTLSGCAKKEPTAADLMRSHAKNVQERAELKEQLAKDWEKGQALVISGEKRVQEGEKLIKKAERDLKQGQEQLERGNREIAEGKNLMQQSESRFQQNYPDLSF